MASQNSTDFEPVKGKQNVSKEDKTALEELLVNWRKVGSMPCTREVRLGLGKTWRGEISGVEVLGVHWRRILVGGFMLLSVSMLVIRKRKVMYARRDGKGGGNEGLSSPFHSGGNFNVVLDITRKKGDKPVEMRTTARTMERKPLSRRSAMSVEMNHVERIMLGHWSNELDGRNGNVSDRDGHGFGMFDNDARWVMKARDDVRQHHPDVVSWAVANHRKKRDVHDYKLGNQADASLWYHTQNNGASARFRPWNAREVVLDRRGTALLDVRR
ncbi:hypothetical protein B0H14DRAFT_2580648 [Mycena olivaceomarginata]|nr:hypothetical protein B0H14DRAFT_2580648 [Mycena olivaceomarginata]